MPLLLPLMLPLLLSLADRATLMSAKALNETSQVMMRKVPRDETPTLLQERHLSLPMFVDSVLSPGEKEYFSPARSTGQEPLLQPVRQLLLPARASGGSPPGGSGVTLRTSCELNKLQLQVERGILGAGEPDSHLKLGTCPVSRATEDYLYFEYDLSLCGTKRAMISNRIIYFNMLLYDPPTPKGPIRRTAPFSLPVACYFNRYIYSYTVGYTPKVQTPKVQTPKVQTPKVQTPKVQTPKVQTPKVQTPKVQTPKVQTPKVQTPKVSRQMNAAKFILTPRNARWEKLALSDHYVPGELVHFEAEIPGVSHDERLYVHTCHVTPDKSHTSTPQISVIKNSGCLVQSEESCSRFFPYKNNAVRFSVDGFLFKGMTGQQLYMHCTMSVGGLVPSPTAKSCCYDTKFRRWVELFGSDSVCDCCESRCSSASPTETQMVSSRPWKIESKLKPGTSTLQRKAVLPTAAALQPERTEWMWKSLPEAAAEILKGKVEKSETEWPFRGGGVTWVEDEGEERRVKGSAVVEDEEETGAEPWSM
ncbi:uncharacterized protein PAE49_005724 [Odontesthes bonariensis]|uniref:uncharacterized protein LOC142380614 n=1 Tax=Odontesthes bonariensis TaxID=219752 RepID=UPI003F580AE1